MKILSRVAFQTVRASVGTALVGFFMATSLVWAQSTVDPKPVATPPKPAPKTVAAVPVKKTTAATAQTKATATAATGASSTSSKSAAQPTAVSTVSATQVSQAATSAVTTPVSQTIPSTVSTQANSIVPSGAAGDSRSPVAGQGIGTFLWPGGWTLTAYGCFRTDTRLFCDFDTTNQNNVQVSSNIWVGGGGVNLVDDGGKITGRHNAFFVGTDGSQFSTAYVTPQPVRFIIEYDDVDPRYSSISLVLGRDRIQRVPITLIDPSTPVERMPARLIASNTASSTQPVAAGTQPSSQAAANGAIDKATSTVNNANAQKQKAQSLWKSLESAVQPH
jgi:hypothetical protein